MAAIVLRNSYTWPRFAVESTRAKDVTRKACLSSGKELKWRRHLFHKLHGAYCRRRCSMNLKPETRKLDIISLQILLRFWHCNIKPWIFVSPRITCGKIPRTRARQGLYRGFLSSFLQIKSRLRRFTPGFAFFLLLLQDHSLHVRP